MAERGAGEIGHDVADRSLDEMVIADIAMVIDAGMAGQAKEAGVLAGAIVAELVGLVAGTGLGDQYLCSELQWQPHSKSASLKAGAACHVAGKLHVAGLAGMRGTGQRQLLVAKAVAVGGAGLDQRQRLHRLDRRAREHRGFDFAKAHHHRSVAIHHHGHAAMPAFNDLAAGDFNKDGVLHGLISWRWLRVRGPYERTL
jgi:hypothetical protein